MPDTRAGDEALAQPQTRAVQETVNHVLARKTNLQRANFVLKLRSPNGTISHMFKIKLEWLGRHGID